MIKIERLKNILSISLYLLIFKIAHRLAMKIRDFLNFKRAKNPRLSYEYEKIFLKNSGFFNCKHEIDKYDFINSIFAEILKNECWDRLINFEEKKFIEENLKNGQMIIKNADLYSSHIFNLLGSGKVKVSYRLKPGGVENNIYYMVADEIEIKNCINKINHRVSLIFKSLGEDELKSLQGYEYDPIDWHIDFKSGYRWDNKTWYKKIKFGTTPGADVKVPWELSRCYHFLTLGQAYFITGDEKYTKEFIYQFIDWVENNPIQFGVNWVCTMDVAIRACNWILSFLYFKNSKLINKEFLYEFIKNIFMHGLHIRKNLEKEPFGPQTNHYLSDLTGLIYIGLFLNQTHYGKKWLKFAVNEFKKQMNYQVYEDGCDYEASTCYHRLVLELVFYSTLFLIKSNPDFNGKNFYEIGEKIFGRLFIKKLYKMFEVILFTLKPNGKIPQIGDNDNGRLHIFGAENILDMKYLFNLASIFYRDSKFKIKEFGFSEEVHWIFGKKGYEIWEKLEEKSINNLGSKAFPDSGWYVMRDRKNYMIVSCGPNGQDGNGGHSHNDKLSFELFVNNNTLITDPGSYIYTPCPEFRNKFRSTSFHNTLVIDNEEQNRFVDWNIFILENDSHVKVNYWKSSEEFDLLDVEHNGYNRLKDPVIHQRQILFNKRDYYWLIRDILKGSGKHNFDLYFHIGGNIKYSVEKSMVINIYNFGDQNLKIMPLDLKDLEFIEEDGWISESYGNKSKSEVFKFSKRVLAPTEFIFLIGFEDFSFTKEQVDNIIKNYLII